MRKLACLFVVLMLAGCSAINPGPKPPVPPPNPDFTITAQWSYDFTNFAACSTAVTTGCIKSFTWGYLKGPTPVVLKTSPASACSGTTQPESCADTMNSQLPMGALTFFVEADFIDNAGVAGESAQTATGTATVVTAGAPGALTVTIK